MKYFKIDCFGALVACEESKDIPQTMDFKDWEEMKKYNGYTDVDFEEITKQEYNADFWGYDVF